jgi:DNA (cytosine-5)-methyltransferase 1
MAPRILDLFCKAGGAARGYQLAGFDVVGVDLAPQPRFPGPFLQADALKLDQRFLRSFDAIHASPPCQAHTAMKAAPGAKAHQDLIPATRALLQASGLPYVIENVVGAPLLGPVMLCGSHFGLGAQGCQLRRHRLFEANFSIAQPMCAHAGPVIGVYGGHARRRSAKHGGRGTRDVWDGGHVAACREAMGIDWATLSEISEAIPPVYARHVGVALLSHLQSGRAAA